MCSFVSRILSLFQIRKVASCFTGLIVFIEIISNRFIIKEKEEAEMLLFSFSCFGPCLSNPAYYICFSVECPLSQINPHHFWRCKTISFQWTFYMYWTFIRLHLHVCRWDIILPDIDGVHSRSWLGCHEIQLITNLKQRK